LPKGENTFSELWELSMGKFTLTVSGFETDSIEEVRQ